jgi:prepilin peptidase CpaA
MQNTLAVPQAYITLAVAAVAAATDVRKGLVYNWLTLPAILLGIGLSIFQEGWTGLGLSILGMVLGGGALLIPFCLGGMGGGDVKLMAAIGAIMGPLFVGETLLVSILAGGIMALGLMIIRGKLIPTLIWYGGCLKTIGRTLLYQGTALTFPKSPEAGTAPFAVSIFIGVVVSHYFNVLSVFGFR